MTFLLIKLTLANWVKAAGQWIGGAWSWVTASTARMLALGLLLSLCLNLYQWRLLSLRANTINAVKVQRKIATEAQTKVNQAPAVKSQVIAEKSNADAKNYYDEGRRAGLAYANAHSVPRSAPCPQRVANLPGTNSTAEVNDGPSEITNMVAVTPEDFDILTDNSLRLAKVRQDAEALIDAGVAEERK